MTVCCSPAAAGRYAILTLAPLLLFGCSKTAEAPAPSSAAPAATASPAPKIPLAKLPKISADAMLAHVKVLSADEFEGRAPGTPGETKTVEYITQQFQKLGLKPGNTDGTFVQKVPLVGITGAEASRSSSDAKHAPARWKNDVVA